ncbi:MAG TPA: FeoA family protein, partial [Terriglobia bacterium]|nr:FeoA family protein [Terriglobia bacterium]
KVTNDQPEFLAYLEKQSLTPGATFVLLEKAPFHGPLKLMLAGRKSPQYLGVEAAKNIHVLPVGLSGAHSRTKRSGPKTLPFPAGRFRQKRAVPPGLKEKPMHRSPRRPQ